MASSALRELEQLRSLLDQPRMHSHAAMQGLLPCSSDYAQSDATTRGYGHAFHTTEVGGL